MCGHFSQNLYGANCHNIDKLYFQVYSRASMLTQVTSLVKHLEACTKDLCLEKKTPMYLFTQLQDKY